MRSAHLLVVPLTVGLLLGGCSSGSGLNSSLTLHAPMDGTDPRSDERIIKALSERGKLVP